MTSYTCIIFDMDGTLTATNRLIFDSFNHIVVREGREPMSDEAIRGLFGPPEEGALGRIVGPERIDDVMEEYLAYYEENHKALADIHSGVRELLRSLKEAGKKLAIFTGKGRHTTAISLRQLDLEGIFDVIITGNDVRKYKPSGEGIRRVMEETGATPADTIMIGDSASDVRAARDAGVAVAAVLWDAHAPQKVLELHPDFVFASVPDLHDWLCA